MKGVDVGIVPDIFGFVSRSNTALSGILRLHAAPICALARRRAENEMLPDANATGLPKLPDTGSDLWSRQREAVADLASRRADRMTRCFGMIAIVLFAFTAAVIGGLHAGGPASMG